MKIAPVLLIALLSALSCRVPQPGTIAQKVVDCSVETVKRQAINAIDPVNDIIADGNLSDSQAKSELRDLGVQIGIDVLACVLRDQGSKFADSASSNPGDVKSALGARRANQYLAEENIRFTDSP